MCIKVFQVYTKQLYRSKCVRQIHFKRVRKTKAVVERHQNGKVIKYANTNVVCVYDHQECRIGQRENGFTSRGRKVNTWFQSFSCYQSTICYGKGQIVVYHSKNNRGIEINTNKTLNYERSILMRRPVFVFTLAMPSICMNRYKSI